MDPWLIAIFIYAVLAIAIAIPTIYAIVKGVKPHDGGSSFESSLNVQLDPTYPGPLKISSLSGLGINKWLKSKRKFMSQSLNI